MAVAVLLAPIGSVLAVLVKREDTGPELMQVDRMGEGSHSFGMRKLRTIRAATADGRASGPALTAENAER